MYIYADGRSFSVHAQILIDRPLPPRDQSNGRLARTFEACSVPANLPYFFSSGSPSWGKISSPVVPSCGNQSTITDPDST